MDVILMFMGIVSIYYVLLKMGFKLVKYLMLRGEDDD